MSKDRSREGVIDCSGDVPLTQQSSKEECDINFIVERVLRGADISMFSRSSAPMYGDFTSLPDYRESLLMVTKARDMFMSLDAKVRFRFHNDPALLLDFLADDSNRDEAMKLGLLKPVDSPPVSGAKVVDVAEAGPGAGSSAAPKGAKGDAGAV